MTEIKSGEFTTAPGVPNGVFVPPLKTGVQDSEFRNLLSALTKGEEALARRKDLTELHKRIVTMFTTLNQGLVDTQTVKAQEDRAQLVERLDQIERSVNGMEGALRIELEPMIRSIVKEVVIKSGLDQQRARTRPFLTGAALCIGIGIGAIYSAEMLMFFNQLLSAIGWAQADNDTVSSLIGGSPMNANLMR